MKNTNIYKEAAISRMGTLGTGALTGSIAGGLGSLSRTDEPTRLIGGLVGGATGGTMGSILPAAVLNSQTAVKMLNSQKAKGFATLFKIINILMSAGGGMAGSRVGENVASVIKNNINNKGAEMLKSSSLGSNGVAALFGNIMKRPMGAKAFNYLKALPKNSQQGIGGISSLFRQSKIPGNGTVFYRPTINRYLDEAKKRMEEVTLGPHYNSPWSPFQRMFGGADMHTPSELLEFVKKMNS